MQLQTGVRISRRADTIKKDQTKRREAGKENRGKW